MQPSSLQLKLRCGGRFGVNFLINHDSMDSQSGVPPLGVHERAPEHNLYQKAPWFIFSEQLCICSGCLGGGGSAFSRGKSNTGSGKKSQLKSIRGTSIELYTPRTVGVRMQVKHAMKCHFLQFEKHWSALNYKCRRNVDQLFKIRMRMSGFYQIYWNKQAYITLEIDIKIHIV